MKKSILSAFALLPLLAGAQQPYEIKGRVGNWNSPAKVYLAYGWENKLILDSSKIEQGNFLFKGQVPATVIVTLALDRNQVGYTNLNVNNADFRHLHLGNEKFSVTSPDSMKNIAIVGSHINDSLLAAAIAKALQTPVSDKTFSPGDTAPSFSQPDTAGKIITLADFRGKTVLVDFWASWCMPCRQENPNLVKAYEKYKSKGFEIVSISLDDAPHRKIWIDALLKDNMKWVNVSDLKGNAGNAAVQSYGVQFIPQNFLVDGNGKIIASMLVGEGTLEKKLEELFAGK